MKFKKNNDFLTGFWQLYFFYFLLISPHVHAHEPWLLTEEQMKFFQAQPRPLVFSQFNFFNVSIIILALLIILGWILFNYYLPEKRQTDSIFKENLTLLLLRIGVGSTLVLLSLGMLPREGITYFTNSTLLAPEFIIGPLNWHWQIIIELMVGLGFLFGVFTRWCAIILLFLLIICFGKYGIEIVQYMGFYLGIIIFLFVQGGGKYGVTSEKLRFFEQKNLLLMLQILTAINFIYSAISIKFLHPNVDIGILEINRAFTFGIPYDYFSFLMFIVEFSFGILLILGYRLQIISLGLIFLFLFLSLNLSENLLAHNFIYGILLTFIVQGGYPLRLKTNTK